MSVPANIVEGSGHQSAREFSRFLRMALNSTTELEYQILTAKDLRVLPESGSLTLLSQIIEVRKMIYGLMRYLSSRAAAGEKPENPRATRLNCVPWERRSACPRFSSSTRMHALRTRPQ